MILTVNASTGYDITLEHGANPAEIIAPLARRVAVICDSNLAELHLQSLLKKLTDAGISHKSFVFTAGEASKNISTLSDILEFLARNRFTRNDALVALGGGVTGDITGLAAALYLRGIKYIQIPTSLVACVDSSVGGKCAIDLQAGKNLAGVFLQPSAVIINPEYLSTLPNDEFACGMAEVIKYGIGFDAELFALCANPQAHIDEIITRCITVKRDVVQKDEFDNGERRKLNLGHTIGHAIEKCSGYTVPHGMAVGIGLAVICRALAPQTAPEVERMLTLNGIPTHTNYTASALFDAATADKKRIGNSVALIVPGVTGSCSVVNTPLEKLYEIIEKGL